MSAKVLEQDQKTSKVAGVTSLPPRKHSKSWLLHLESRTAIAGPLEPALEPSPKVHIMYLSDQSLWERNRSTVWVGNLFQPERKGGQQLQPCPSPGVWRLEAKVPLPRTQAGPRTRVTVPEPLHPEWCKPAPKWRLMEFPGHKP